MSDVNPNNNYGATPLAGANFSWENDKDSLDELLGTQPYSDLNNEGGWRRVGKTKGKSPICPTYLPPHTVLGLCRAYIDHGWA
eukprot:10424334-Ditylum_brightwellii.AAC.1